MSALDAIRDLASQATAQLGRTITIVHRDATLDGWNETQGVPTDETAGLFTTRATFPAGDAMPVGMVGEVLETACTIACGEALTGTYFQPGKNDRVRLAEGPDLTNGQARWFRIHKSPTPVAQGGGLRLSLVVATGVGQLGSGEQPD